jgi:hypothetical protein
MERDGIPQIARKIFPEACFGGGNNGRYSELVLVFHYSIAGMAHSTFVGECRFGPFRSASEKVFCIVESDILGYCWIDDASSYLMQ